MNRVRCTVVALVAAFLVVPGIAMAGAQGSPHLTATLTDARVSPGEDATLSVQLLNDGEVEYASVSTTYPSIRERVTTARAVTVTMNEGSAPITVHTDTQGVGSLGDGTSATFDFDVSVKASAKPGTYEVPVHVAYTYTDYVSTGDGTHEQTTRNRTLHVQLRVLDDARFQVVDVDSNARVGATDTVTLAMTNTGTDPGRDARVTLTSTNGALTFAGAQSATRYVGQWDRGETKRVRFRVSTTDSAGSQRYAFEARTTFRDADGTTKTGETLPVGVRTKRQQAFSVVATDSDVRVDDRGTLNVTLRNEGPITARDATVTLTSENPAVTFGESGTAIRYVGQWAAGERETVQVQTDVAGDATPSDYAVSATVSYEDGEGDAERSSALALGLRPAPERRFAVDDVTSDFHVGEDGTLTATVSNPGPGRARDAVVVVETPARSLVLDETTAPLGTLAAGQSATFEIPVRVRPGSEPGPRSLTVTVRYRTASGETRTSDDVLLTRQVAPRRDRVVLSPVEANVTIDHEADLVVRIRNDWDRRLESVSATATMGPPLTATSPQAYRASLAPGQSARLTFGVDVADDAVPATTAITINVTGKTPDGERVFLGRHYVPVTVVEESAAGSDVVVLALGGVVVAVILATGWWWLRR
ncbi:MAG: COG1361 S-layer family protein [Haloarculaceae archaeon]